ncbi:hypothetical protein ABZP36_009664 [Zizania latifolia]
MLSTSTWRASRGGPHGGEGSSSSLNRLFLPKHGDIMATDASTNGDINRITHFATYLTIQTPKNVFGAMGTFDYYDFPNTKNGSGIAAQIWLQNDQNGLLNGITCGWEADGDKSTGCSNLVCTGFVPVNGAPITPGDVLDHNSGQTKISLKIFKSKDDGDWWLYFGHDINNLNPVGYWPISLFNSLDHATLIAWGGATASYRGDSSPPMGNGQWPEKGAASVQDVKFVDKDGQGYLPPWPASIHAQATHKRCYQTSIFMDHMFYYGGPGTTSSLNRLFPPRHGDMIATNASTDGDINPIPHFATYLTIKTPKNVFAGAMGTLDYYDFPSTKKGSVIAAQIWIQNDQNGPLNGITSGWEIDEEKYRDSKTHFFIEWTADDEKSTGCFNLDCTGFVPVNGAPITPGDILDHSSGQTKISLKIFKSKDDGDWWLHFGHDINNLNPVG